MGSDSSLVRADDTGTETKTGTEPTTGSNDRARSSQRDDTTALHTYACPLCGFTDEAWDTVYDHLLCSHRKRAISSALLEARSNRE